ncbi:sugar phosphate nucleotidyltransferase [uncultured Croceitalea sp.]|uniref:sugar phosphate nucleotidyltransferase n=1 Tax=uncultured Croceitalea sp. TaxID=1798908 RepID=UPI003305D0C6
MKNESLIIMAGGASSRMKRSLASSGLDDETITIAKNLHKTLIPLGKAQKPLLFYLLKNAIDANVKDVYVITSPENKAFIEFAEDFFKDEEHRKIKLNFAIQNVPQDREKPLGTADALQQCMDQYPKLLEERFTVCNGDNLYSTNALKDLKKERVAPNALISYSSSGLNFSDERISKFALMDIDNNGFLKGIVEKPKPEEVNQYRDDEGILRVSMNIFNFSGNVVYPYLENCMLDPIRNEKELPQAVRKMVIEVDNSVLCYPRSEGIPDLTDANDLKRFLE